MIESELILGLKIAGCCYCLPMDWLHYSIWLQEERVKMHDGHNHIPIPHDATSVSAWQKTLLTYRDQIDFHCQVFAATRQWKVLTPLQKSLIAWRFHWASEVATLMSLKPATIEHVNPKFPMPPDFGESALLRWLLIDAWRSLGEEFAARLIAAALAPKNAGDALPADKPPFDWN